MFCNGLVQAFESQAIPLVLGGRQPIVTHARLAPLVQQSFSVEPVRFRAFPSDSAPPVAGLVLTLTSLTAMPP